MDIIKWFAEIDERTFTATDIDGKKYTINKKDIIQFYRGSKPRRSTLDSVYQVEIDSPPKDFDYQGWHDVVFTDETKTKIGWKVNKDIWLNVKVRPERNEKLKQSDWTQVPDNGMSDFKKQEWKAYRQKLRDLPDTIEYGNEQWPEEPK